jgi:hypothetical protein
VRSNVVQRTAARVEWDPALSLALTDIPKRKRGHYIGAERGCHALPNPKTAAAATCFTVSTDANIIAPMSQTWWRGQEWQQHWCPERQQRQRRQ